MGRDVTIHSGYSARNWVPVLVLALFGLVAVSYGLYELAMNPGSLTDSAKYPATAVGGLFIYCALSLLGFAALFRDSAYVRSAENWNPKWYFFISIPLLVGVAIAAGVSSLINGRMATMYTLLGFAAASFGSQSMYIVRRHRNVGVP